MIDHLTEEEVITAIPSLTRTRLFTFIETEVVIPLRREAGARPVFVFRRVDLARIGSAVLGSR